VVLSFLGRERFPTLYDTRILMLGVS
jgi:hypothetical protein